MAHERVDQSLLDTYVRTDKHRVMDLLMAYEVSHTKLPNAQHLLDQKINQQTIRDLDGIENIYVNYNSMLSGMAHESAVATTYQTRVETPYSTLSSPADVLETSGYRGIRPSADINGIQLAGNR